MAFIVKNISVDVAAKNILKSVIAKQYDIDSRFLKVRLTNEGKQINVSPTSVATINARRKDNKAKAFAGTVNEDGTVTFPIANWILELDGQVKCDISVIDSEQRKLTSSTFIITVEAASCSNTDISEDENYDILVSLIAEISKMTVDSELSAESEHPVQNKAVKAALDNKLDNSAGSVKGANLAEGCVSWDKIGDGQVTATKIANNAVYSRHIVDGNVTEEKLSTDVAEKINSAATKEYVDSELEGKLSDSVGSVKGENLADGSIKHSNLDVALKKAIDTIGAVQKEELFDERDGLYVTKRITTMGDGEIDVIYDDPFWFLALIEGRHIIIISRENGIFKISRSGTKSPYFDSAITEDSINAPTGKAVYQAIQNATMDMATTNYVNQAIQDALYVNTEEVIE